MRICLIGARGVGKSKTARRLAVLLKRPAVSTDVLVSYECGGDTVADIIKKRGGGPDAWRFFRECEFKVLKKVVKLPTVIVDCGGGIVVDLTPKGKEKFSARKARLIRKNSVVVWLKADPAKIERKIEKDPRRPALSGAESVRSIMRRRAPFYRRAAHLTVNAGGKNSKSLARKILRKLEPLLPAG